MTAPQLRIFCGSRGSWRDMTSLLFAGGRCEREGGAAVLPTIHISVRSVTERVGATITIRVDIRVRPLPGDTHFL